MSLIGFETSLLENKNCFFRVKKVGKEFCNPKKRAEDRVRDYYSLHFVIYGSGTLKIGDEKEVVLNAGTAFLLYAGDHYEYVPDRRNPWSYVWIDFYGDNLDELFSQAGFSHEKPFVKLRSTNTILSILNDLHQTYYREVFSDMTVYGYFMMVLDYLLKNNREYASKDINEVLRAQQVREMLTYMNNNYALDLTVSGLADTFHVSYRTLMRLFDEEIGMSPKEYLINFRISTACEMFARNDSYSIAEVATACGFVDIPHFSKIFKQKKGVTPMQYVRDHDDDHPFDWLKEKNIDLR